MKRLLCALILIALLFAFAGCNEKPTTANGGLDIAYYADLGSVPESDVKLGDDVPKETEEDDTYFFIEDGKNSYFSSGDFMYFYDPDAKETKVYAIAALSKFFGFEIGAVSIEVTDTLTAAGIEYTERAASEKDVFFLPSGDFTVVECKNLKNSLVFVFEENSLCAALLSQIQ